MTLMHFMNNDARRSTTRIGSTSSGQGTACHAACPMSPLHGSFVLLAVFLISGCVTTAGPFVTNVLPAGDGKVSIERCKAKYNSFLNTLSTGECDSVLVQVVDVSSRDRRGGDVDDDDEDQPKQKRRKKRD